MKRTSRHDLPPARELADHLVAEVKPCSDCRRPMVSQSAMRKDPDLRQKFAAHSCRGLCTTCRKRHTKAGTLIDFERTNHSRDEVLDEWVILRDEGNTVPQAARRLGMTTEAMRRALARARKDGDPRARFDWRGCHTDRRGGAA